MPTEVAGALVPSVTNPPKHDDSRKMKGVEFHGKKDMRVVDRSVPLVTDPQDVILKVTSTCICGSDLHLYLQALPGVMKHDLFGHEFMGVVDDVGPEVKSVKKGDRVVACFDIACGQCFYCKKEIYTGCDATNPPSSGPYPKAQETMYGHTTAGLHGYSHMTGGWEGGQAEYARVPFADVNLLKVPEGMPDDQVVLLSDILPTAWHATELGRVGEGDVVAIWGAGPVGILTAQCAKVRGASRVILIDNVSFRLQFAKEKLPYVETLDFSKDKTTTKLREMVPQGPDVAIEAAGFHYCKSWLHTIEMTLKLETDPADILNELITSVRKGGRISIVGVYGGYTNHYNIGAFMEKGLSMAAGQTPVQKYWHHLLDLVKAGKLDPTVVITHVLPLEQASEAYKMFNDKTDGCVKVVLKPGLKAEE